MKWEKLEGLKLPELPDPPRRGEEPPMPVSQLLFLVLVALTAPVLLIMLAQTLTVLMNWPAR